VELWEQPRMQGSQTMWILECFTNTVLTEHGTYLHNNYDYLFTHIISIYISSSKRQIFCLREIKRLKNVSNDHMVWQK
jgi:hypothetical protein